MVSKHFFRVLFLMSLGLHFCSYAHKIKRQSSIIQTPVQSAIQPQSKEQEQDIWRVELPTGTLRITTEMLELSYLLRSMLLEEEQNVSDLVYDTLVTDLDFNLNPPEGASSLEVLSQHDIDAVETVLALQDFVLQTPEGLPIPQKINLLLETINNIHIQPEDIVPYLTCAHDLKLRGDKSVIYALAQKACQFIQQGTLQFESRTDGVEVLKLPPTLSREIALASVALGIPELRDCANAKIKRTMFGASLGELIKRGYVPNIHEQDGEMNLNLSNLHLTSLDGLTEIQGIEQVTCLDISHNNLTDISIPIMSCTNLKKLYMQNNKIADFNWLFALPQLQQLKVDPSVRDRALMTLKSLYGDKRDILANEMRLPEWIKRTTPVKPSAPSNSLEEIQRRLNLLKRSNPLNALTDAMDALDTKKRRTDGNDDDPMQL